MEEVRVIERQFPHHDAVHEQGFRQAELPRP